MNRNMYDTDATTFSPEGRLYQVQYATEAVQQGSACVGMVSKDYAVLVALKRCVAHEGRNPTFENTALLAGLRWSASFI